MPFEKLSEKILGVKKPLALTAKGWNDWHKSIKAERPVRYWLSDTGVDVVESVVMWIPRRIKDIQYYIKNRFVNKSHALTADKNLISRGQWCDVGDRLLPCLFSELVNFVEQEAGIEHLEWASRLTYDETPEPTPQALGAKEILELYTWFKDVYPNRPDPHEASGWSAYCAKRNFDILEFEEESEEQRAEIKQILDELNKIEKAYSDEDEQMMIRLIKARDSLWV